jgi:hypothetical protein
MTALERALHRHAFADPAELASCGADHWYAQGLDWAYRPDRPGDPDYLEHVAHGPRGQLHGRVRLFPDGCGAYLILRVDTRAPAARAITSASAPTLPKALARAAALAAALYPSVDHAISATEAA